MVEEEEDEEWDDLPTREVVVIEADEPGTLVSAVPPIPPPPEPLMPPSIVRHLERLKGDGV